MSYFYYPLFQAADESGSDPLKQFPLRVDVSLDVDYPGRIDELAVIEKQY